MKKFRLFFERWKWYFVNAFILCLLLAVGLGIYALSQNSAGNPAGPQSTAAIATPSLTPVFSLADENLDRAIKAIWQDEADGTLTEKDFVNLNLASLDVSGLNITDLEGLQKNQSIQTLDLSGNHLSSIASLLNMDALERVDLRNGSVDLSSESILNDIQALQANGVEVLYDESKTTPASGASSAGDYSWIDRSDTQSAAIDYSQENFSQADSAVLVREGALPDFASSALLATTLNAPVFPITDGDNQAVFDEINRLGQNESFTVYIIGGDYVIPDDLIYAQSFNTHITIQRIYGAHMDGTAVAVLGELSSLSSPTTAYVINGAIDASCVTAASLSAENGYPVLLVDYSGPTDATLAAISDFGLTDIIILGEGVTQKTISALERILGEEHVTKQGEE